MYHLQCVRLQHQVAALRRVTGDVAKGPHGLLPHVVVGRPEEVYEDRDRAVLDNLEPERSVCEAGASDKER